MAVLCQVAAAGRHADQEPPPHQLHSTRWAPSPRPWPWDTSAQGCCHPAVLSTHSHISRCPLLLSTAARSLAPCLGCCSLWTLIQEQQHNGETGTSPHGTQQPHIALRMWQTSTPQTCPHPIAPVRPLQHSLTLPMSPKTPMGGLHRHPEAWVAAPGAELYGQRAGTRCRARSGLGYAMGPDRKREHEGPHRSPGAAPSAPCPRGTPGLTSPRLRFPSVTTFSRGLWGGGGRCPRPCGAARSRERSRRARGAAMAQRSPVPGSGAAGHGRAGTGSRHTRSRGTEPGWGCVGPPCEQPGGVGGLSAPRGGGAR